MYSETDGGRKTIGDVDIVFHEGLYHLFHLVLPNHDFIAHAVSTDGIHWRRVKNALFIGDPGSWDDLMLWTMHVSPCPHNPGRWRMFYTGLSRREHGRMQRIGLAISEDLYEWRKAPVHWQDRRGPNDPPLVKKAREQCEHSESTRLAGMRDPNSSFPLSPDHDFYEASLSEDRGLISFRDPYFFHDGENGWLLVAARVNEGPLTRRGCVGLLKETEPNHFASQPPLHHPRLYDDVEVPNIVNMDGNFYLIGSIREDAKIRYWYADHMSECWRSYHDNVLMAQGNYAARVCRDEKGWLIWNFFSMHLEDRTANNLMPPPKRLTRTPEGLLRTQTYERFDDWTHRAVDAESIHCLIGDVGHENLQVSHGELDLVSECGFHAFVFKEEVESFRLRATLQLLGKGKCGFVFRINSETHDGYYLSLDLLKGVAQLRSWATGPIASGENMMQFRTLQAGFWYTETPGRADFHLMVFGSYIELSVNGRIILSLANQDFCKGHLGFYLETAHLHVSNLAAHHMHRPSQSDDHLVEG